VKKISIYTDGSSLGNPGPGGYCAILEYELKGKIHKKIVSGGEAHTTNNRMELKGAIEGLKALKSGCEVDIITDSKYVADAINGWIFGWIKKEFKGVKNTDLWAEYLEVSKPHKVKAQWVRGHSGHPQNEECDVIAKNEAEKF
jgi:ribonuclease HI